MTQLTAGNLGLNVKKSANISVRPKPRKGKSIFCWVFFNCRGLFIFLEETHKTRQGIFFFYD